MPAYGSCSPKFWVTDRLWWKYLGIDMPITRVLLVRLGQRVSEYQSRRHRSNAAAVKRAVPMNLRSLRALEISTALAAAIFEGAHLCVTSFRARVQSPSVAINLYRGLRRLNSCKTSRVIQEGSKLSVMPTTVRNEIEFS